MEISKAQKHFILVHGSCHGAWCWYKLKPLLEASGHKVTAFDLSASGINTKKFEEITSLYDYTIPLLEILKSLNPNEKVILVGHSYGGMNLALAMDKYPDKISIAVFLTAFIPDTDHAPSYVIEKFFNETPPEDWLDSQFLPYNGPNNEPLTALLFGPEFLSSKLYQLCSAQDIALANMLVRPISTFVEDLSKSKNFSKEGFGSVKQVYIICDKDMCVSKEFQSWQIENNKFVTEVMEIKNADHMAMISTPHELSRCLSHIANKYD